MIFLDAEGADRMHMEAQERALRITRFMDELKPDDAYTFMEIMHAISSSENPHAMTNYMAGQMAAIVRSIHHLCVSCGQDHSGIDHMSWMANTKENDGKTDEEADGV